MNNRLAPRLFALASAAFFTVVMLSGIDSLAAADGASAYIAQSGAAAPRA
ncbi:hypothetical protein [Rubrivivax benzoatilyticus]|uniref:Uncharacterized protein n=1 Tax=Rubrivivax benzoatilyticus TaxID=316997 RepID=A0ABX0HUS6_9BURK|nr:hypothetical protein [Rubrivivax benzoatilyticus]EGJ09440.1 hypothetical protein RBXJA2T_03893 [Rubrivivax benzoatilyticus JA2 = ATCC BAA-35]NHK98752.1 hypothetical protein [Rubrivivax benzoatilyticus]NHL24254.1 hypothetical protein [Rubrivivax benzoatilyticus]